MGSVGGERFKSRRPNFQVVEPITQGSVFEAALSEGTLASLFARVRFRQRATMLAMSRALCLTSDESVQFDQLAARHEGGTTILVPVGRA
jgi:hypothetical protein